MLTVHMAVISSDHRIALQPVYSNVNCLDYNSYNLIFVDIVNIFATSTSFMHAASQYLY